MKRFFILYMASEEDFKKAMAGMENAAPKQRRESMREWEEWMKKAGFVDGGAALGKTKRVTADSITDMRNGIGGYSIVEAEDHDAAARLVQDSPHFKMMPGGWIELMEIMPM